MKDYFHFASKYCFLTKSQSKTFSFTIPTIPLTISDNDISNNILPFPTEQPFEYWYNQFQPH
jgi:hypothetical protein